MKVIFLDRDGTVVVEPTSFRVELDGLELFPDTLQALMKLANAGFSIVFVTNQMSIADGTLSLEEYEATNKKMLELIKPTGVKVLKIYLCPHAPRDSCVCRKPQPTMLLQAAQEFDINLAQSFMVGDRITDVEAGIAAGTKTVLIPQGNFRETSDKPNYTATNLLDAVTYIIRESATI